MLCRFCGLLRGFLVFDLFRRTVIEENSADSVDIVILTRNCMKIPVKKNDPKLIIVTAISIKIVVHLICLLFLAGFGYSRGNEE